MKHVLLKAAVPAIALVNALGTGCENPADGGDDKSGHIVRYVAGIEENADGKNIAVVWKLAADSAVTDTITLPLADESVYAEVCALIESRGSLYAAGYEEKQDGKEIAVVWKITGGLAVRIPLTNGSQYAEARALIESGGSLYAAGYENDGTMGGQAVAKVWRITNGTAAETMLLPGGTSGVYAEALIESGGSLYAAGSEETPDGQAVAKVWKITNGAVTETITLPSDGNKSAYTRVLLAESGGSLYAAGYEDGEEEEVAVVWKITGGPVCIPLTDGSQDANVTALIESGGSLYAVGSEDSEEENVAMVWKITGDQVEPIPLTDGSQDADAKALIESGGSLYAAGSKEAAPDGKEVATIWKITNGVVETFATIPRARDTVAYAIVEVRE